VTASRSADPAPSNGAATTTTAPTQAEAKAGAAADRAESGASVAISLPKTSDSPQLLRIRHSMSHVLAMAVQKLFPKAQVTIGPWTESGFYYDFDNPEPFTEADLKAIKKKWPRSSAGACPYNDSR
jgi:threonyl-tRNA synthetase